MDVYQLVLLCRELGFCLHYVTTLRKLFIGHCPNYVRSNKMNDCQVWLRCHGQVRDGGMWLCSGGHYCIDYGQFTTEILIPKQQQSRSAHINLSHPAAARCVHRRNLEHVVTCACWCVYCVLWRTVLHCTALYCAGTAAPGSRAQVLAQSTQAQYTG